MGTSKKVPIFACIVREGGLPVPLHRFPLQDQLGLQGFVYSLRPPKPAKTLEVSFLFNAAVLYWRKQ